MTAEELEAKVAALEAALGQAQARVTLQATALLKLQMTVDGIINLVANAQK
jgi:hypothetical protein